MPYCQQAPKNAELAGLFQCQFQGANPKTFVGGVAVGQPGTIPFGLKAPLNPAGSCPANPNGPIAAGTQLVDITQNPGVGNTGSGAAAAPPAASSAAAKSAAATAPVADSATASPSPAAAGAGGFKLQNGKDAQALNAKFATLTAQSSCNGTSFPIHCLPSFAHLP